MGVSVLQHIWDNAAPEALSLYNTKLTGLNKTKNRLQQKVKPKLRFDDTTYMNFSATLLEKKVLFVVPPSSTKAYLFANKSSATGVNEFLNLLK